MSKNARISLQNSHGRCSDRDGAGLAWLTRDELTIDASAVDLVGVDTMVLIEITEMHEHCEAHSFNQVVCQSAELLGELSACWC